jgi:hypothetical protein
MIYSPSFMVFQLLYAPSRRSPSGLLFFPIRPNGGRTCLCIICLKNGELSRENKIYSLAQRRRDAEEGILEGQEGFVDQYEEPRKTRNTLNRYILLSACGGQVPGGKGREGDRHLSRCFPENRDLRYRDCGIINVAEKCF